MTRLLPLCAAAGLLACTGNSATRAKPTPPTPATEAAQAPLRVFWADVGQNNDLLTMVAHVEFRSPIIDSVTVTLQVPPGVELLEGESKQTVRKLENEHLQTLRYVFRVRETPKEDLVLVADVQGEGFGFHSADPYRFGRPPPEVAPVQRLGPTVKIGGVEIGPAVQGSTAK